MPDGACRKARILTSLLKKVIGLCATITLNLYVSLYLQMEGKKSYTKKSRRGRMVGESVDSFYDCVEMLCPDDIFHDTYITIVNEV